MWLSSEVHKRINNGNSYPLIRNCSRSPEQCECADCLDVLLLRRLDDQSVADFHRKSASNYNKYSPKQNIGLEESKIPPYLRHGLRYQIDHQKSSLTSEGNLNSSSNKQAQSIDKILGTLSKMLLKRRGVLEHLNPANAVSSNVDVAEASRTPSPFTGSVERKVNDHLAKAFEKLDCADRKRLEGEISPAKHDAKSLLAKRKLVDCAKEECPVFQGRSFSIPIQEKETRTEESRRLEKNRVKEMIQRNRRERIERSRLERLKRYRLAEMLERPRFRARRRISNLEINRTNMPHWKTYLDNMKVPRSAKSTTFLDNTWPDAMDYAEETPAVEQSRIVGNRRGVGHAALRVDFSGDETGYESEVQTADENELSHFQESINRPASRKSNRVRPLEMNASRSLQIVGNSNTTASLSIKECFKDLEKTKVFDMLYNSDENSPFLYLNPMQEMLHDMHENERERSRKIPDYSKPGCSKDADCMGDFSMRDVTRSTSRFERQSFLFESDNIHSPPIETSVTRIKKSYLS